MASLKDRLMNSSELRKQVALEILRDSADVDSDTLQKFSPTKQPQEWGPKYLAWGYEALGRYCFALAEKFVQGYEAQREAWGKE